MKVAAAGDFATRMTSSLSVTQLRARQPRQDKEFWRAASGGPHLGGRHQRFMAEIGNP